MKIKKILTSIHAKVKSILRKITFRTSKDYWENRYKKGGNSGDGSYNKLAEFKAEILNDFVFKNNILSVIEFGCGDGNQLKLANYPSYIGLDVSAEAIRICREKFSADNSKKFFVVDEYKGEKADLVLSLDVIFHLIEDQVFSDYMKSLFRAAEKYVIIYSSNYDMPKVKGNPHVRHREFTKWIDENAKEWELLEMIKNRYPFNGNSAESSFSDFYIYKKIK